MSWLSNCLSFLRVGTYAICHAIMMLIVYALSETSGATPSSASCSATSSSWASRRPGVHPGAEAGVLRALRPLLHGPRQALEPAHIDYSAPLSARPDRRCP
ncbi:MAG: hypothetical protein ACLUEK_11335 [Oscillospiraceae bacterium]